MTPRLVIVTEIIAPYRIPVFNALAARADVGLHVIFLSETDATLRQWHVYKEEIRFSYEILPSWRRRVGKYNLLVNRGVTAALQRARPDALLCGGYNYLACWEAAWWARRHRVPILLWSESTIHDARNRKRLVEYLKRRFRSQCRAFVVAGKSSHDYLLHLGATQNVIFTAPDAVDVNLYATLAETARQHRDEVRAQHQLPARYFLYVGRLIEEKGVFDLLAAFSTLDHNQRSQVGLVFAGDGAARSQLEKRAADIVPGCVRFCGFVHREQLPALYALAEALVFPTHSDPWGLVVNEAMACGLPVIATQVAGCVPDLVEHGNNGFVVAAADVRGIAGAMRRIIDDPAMAAQMGRRSSERIQSYTPELCADGLAKAAVFVCKEIA